MKEPLGLLRSNGKSREGATVIPWAKGKLIALDVTVPDTFAESHLSSTAAEQGAAGKQAAGNNTAKYQVLEKAHIFFPLLSRQQKNCLPVSDSVRGSSRWKCGLIRRHFRPRSVRRCSHLQLFIILRLRICDSGRKNNDNSCASSYSNLHH